jgi:hypothetical protein
MSYSTAVLADTPLAFYRMNEASGGTMTDSSGNGHDGAYSGTFTLGSTGLVKDGATAVAFSTAQGQVGWGSWMYTTAETIECWIKTTQTSGYQGLINRDDGSQRSYQFRINGTTLEFITINGGAGVVVASKVTAGITDGAAHHVVATYDASNIKMYVDGSLVNTTAAVGALSGSVSSLMVGNYYGGIYPFAGTMADVALYGYSLSEAQIVAHYTAGVSSGGASTGTQEWPRMPKLTSPLVGQLWPRGA